MMIAIQLMIIQSEAFKNLVAMDAMSIPLGDSKYKDVNLNDVIASN